jgi:hypothetical protein
MTFGFAATHMAFAGHQVNNIGAAVIPGSSFSGSADGNQQSGSVSQAGRDAKRRASGYGNCRSGRKLFYCPSSIFPAGLLSGSN